jgi:NADH-quinone oxidoreductase subunit M
MVALLLLIVPLLFASISLLAKAQAKWMTLFSSVITLGIAIIALINYYESSGSLLALNVSWVSSLGIHFNIGIDGISLVLVLLTALLFPFIVGSAFQHNYKNPQSFYALMLLMQFGLMGVFMARDAFLFYIFYELTLILIYFICAFWGGERSIPITIKFFIYTLAGSLLMLVALIYLYFKTPIPHTFDISAFYHLQLSASEQSFIFWAFFLAFAIKIPIFPFHTWQPDTYTVSPAAGTMLLAGLMLKMGIYGLIRFVLPIVPDALAQWGNTAIVLCIIGIIYASLIALRQNNLKTLVAYSSIAHVGLIAAGVLTLTPSGLQGAVIQMFNHGVNVVAMFFIIDLLEINYGTQWMGDFSGVAGMMKKFGVLTIIVLLGSVGLPLTNGFIGEFLLLNGLYQHSPWAAAFAGLTLILGAAYMLRFYRNVFLGEENAATKNGRDIHGNQLWILVPLVLLIIFFGILPNTLLTLSEGSVQQILQSIHQHYNTISTL